VPSFLPIGRISIENAHPSCHRIALKLPILADTCWSIEFTAESNVAQTPIRIAERKAEMLQDQSRLQRGLVRLAMLTLGTTMMTTGCSPEAIRALIIGLDAAADQIEDDDNISFEN